MTRIQSASQSTPDPTTIYCSVEVSRSSWIVGVHCPLTDANIGIHKLPPGGGNDLIDLVRKSQARVGSEVPVMLCYEVSYEGFWLVRYLERRAPDIEVVVLDPASLQVDRRFKKVKTDRLDAERMIRALKAWHAGDGDAMSPVRVPSIEEEDRRRLVRERDSLLGDRQRCRNRIQSLLHLHGIFDLKPGTRDIMSHLAETETGYGTPLPPHALAEIFRIRTRLDLIEDQISVVETQRDELVRVGKEADPETVERMAATLTRVRGIGTNDATMMATEVFSREFRNRRQIGSWAGLTSAPWSSGAVDHDQGITKSGPSRVRKHLIQMAWRWLRFQPGSKLTLWYREGTRDGHGRNRRRMIVALARKLLVALWQLATRGVVPEGAIIQ
ncbi:MAG: IS110 family transposase [Paracoccaceae bacterium]|nr:IS110 family transposase [Paracoccaceae bacterium]